MCVAAQTCICADGGANRLYSAAPSFAPHLSAVEARRRAKPAAIAGDLDSISKDVLQFYSDEGSIITDLSHDQDSTDFQKCLCELEKQFDTEHLRQCTIIAAGLWHLACTFFPLCNAVGFARLLASYLLLHRYIRAACSGYVAICIHGCMT